MHGMQAYVGMLPECDLLAEACCRFAKQAVEVRLAAALL